MPMAIELHPDTLAVVNVLRGVNDSISWEQLAKLAGLTLKRLKKVQLSARNILDRDMIGFGVITGWGLKRLADSEKAKMTTTIIEKADRGMKRGLKRTNMADTSYNTMEKSDQHLYTANRQIMHMVRGLAKGKVAPKEPEQPKPDSAPLPNVAALIAQYGNQH